MLPLLRREACLVIALLVLGCGGTEPRVPTTIVVTPSAVVLNAVGETQQLSPSVSDQHGNPLTDATVTWSSSDDNVASVSSSGLVTAQGSGTAQVFAEAGSATAQVAVSVVQIATQLVKVSGDGQTSNAGDALGAPIVVEVRDALGNTVAGATVEFDAEGGGILDPPVATSGADGRASTMLTTGTVAGVLQTVTARIPGTTISVAFTATTRVGPPTSISPASGNNQQAAVGSQVPVRPSVSVRDAHENPVEGVPVEFEVVSGGGSITGGSQVTDQNGQARVGSWTLGSSGPNTLRATATGAAISGNPVTFSASTTPKAFNIEVRFLSSATAAQVAAFTSAEVRWENLVTGDVDDVPIDVPADACDEGTPALDETIDDVIIFATIAVIDGPGGILGQAGPCFIREPGVLPAVGVMFFDSEDLEFIEGEDLLEPLILHEMAHVLGFGTLWLFQDLIADPADPDLDEEDTHFTGPQAIAAFDDAGGSSYLGGKVPVENTGESGTANSHWRESVFSNELMTGFIDVGANPLSAISVAALADQGYSVDVSEADPFTLSLSGLRVGPGKRLRLTNDVRRLPIKVVDKQGRLRLLRR